MTSTSPKDTTKAKFIKYFNDKTVSLQSANDMKIFIVLSESPLKVRRIAVYRFLISFLVPELLRFKHLKNGRKMRGLG